VILKPGYAPIEQYDEIPGMKQGPWTDLYALGALMHFAITGRPPPPSVGRLVHDAWVPLSQAAAGRYSAGFLAAIDAVLAARPDDRPRNVAQWRARLADPAGGAPALAAAPAVDEPPAPHTPKPTTARSTTVPRTATAPAAPVGRPTDAAPRGRQRWGAAIVVGVLTGGLVIFGLWAALTWQTRETAPRVSVPPPAVTRSEPAVPNTAPITAPNTAQPAAASTRGDSPRGDSPRRDSPRGAPPASTVAPPVASPSLANSGPPARAPASGAAAPAPARAAAVPDARGAARGITESGKTTTSPAIALGTPPAPAAAAETARIDTALREGRDCLAARQYACTIARAESVLQAEPNHPAAQALLKEGRAAQEAALGGDWKMR
jgi:hypothetical protein